MFGTIGLSCYFSGGKNHCSLMGGYDLCGNGLNWGLCSPLFSAWEQARLVCRGDTIKPSQSTWCSFFVRCYKFVNALVSIG